MSHSKTTKRGKSLYVDKWNPYAKKYINTCSICGKQGYKPSVDEDGFTNDAKRLSDLEPRVIRSELRKILEPLAVDSMGRCAQCAKLMDKQYQ